jgi:CubicO group peptidase (beta-lactamase class C family)
MQPADPIEKSPVDLTAAVAFAREHESLWARDPLADPQRWGIHLQDRPPWNRLLGPVQPRGPASGVVVHRGREVASWGEPDRADLTFSVAKTYLAILAGVAFDAGVLPDPDEPVCERVAVDAFGSPHNRAVTWTHLLQQTSEWEGECFGLPDQVDRYRVLAYQRTAAAGAKGDPRPLQAPGSHWEYNDVRINVLSMALLHLFGRPLPEVFREAVAGPIGMSPNWHWTGYDNSWVDVTGADGRVRRLQSVPGGSHWGGGIAISARDQALIGRLLLQRGRWGESAVLSEAWIERMLTPCAIAPFYGYLTWLNAGQRVFPGAPASSCFAIGAGSSYTWIDPLRDAVVIVRWIDPDYADRLFVSIGAALDGSDASASARISAA